MWTPEALMQLAIDKCREGIADGQAPFGCAIARGDELLAVEHNTMRRTFDVTAHAEINALRTALARRRALEIEGAIMATTGEPCPMCTAAIHWAHVATVHYGASIADIQAAGFVDMQIPSAEIKRLGGSTIELVHGPLSDECRKLFDEWRSRAARQGDR